MAHAYRQYVSYTSHAEAVSTYSRSLGHELPFVFGFLGSSQQLLYVLGDLLRLADDVLCARQGGIFLGLLAWLHWIRGWKWAAANEKKAF